MQTKVLIDLAGNPNFISGIFNYCDRWCERCPFTSRCLLYATENEDAEDPATNDMNNAEFWRKLDEIFRQTQELLQTLASDHGIDLSDIPEELLKEQQDELEEARKDELSIAAEDYAIAVGKWLEEKQAALELVDREPSDPSESQALDVICWYQLQISSKIVRGVLSSNNEFEEDVNEFDRDSNGSIKVALIGIERSIGAWRILQTTRLDLSASISPFLIMLEMLRSDLEQSFPNARDFIRPGFDEAPGIN